MSNKLFQELDLSNKPKRNGFDLGCKVNFTAKAGELLPIYHKAVMPGDSIRLKMSHFTRTAPVDTAAATQIREYFDAFFVPYRLLWKNAPAVHTNNQRNPVSASSPVSNNPVGTQTPQFDFKQFIGDVSHIWDSPLFTLASKQNAFGLYRSYGACKLLNHLGYSYFTNKNIYWYMAPTNENYSCIDYHGPRYLSLYPLLAYQCIYYNFFRNTQWETNQPYNYNVDYLSSSALVNFVWKDSDSAWNSNWSTYWDNPTLFDLQYANYPKDLFFGVMPDSQFGDTAEVSVNATGTVDDFSVGVTSYDGDTVLSKYTGSATKLVGSDESTPVVGALYGKPYEDVTASMTTSLNILELRKAQFLQKYKEIIGSGSNDYGTVIRKIFGVNVPDTLTNVPVYLGGRSSTVQISEVENTNLTNSASAIQRGKGTGSSQSDELTYEVKEHGLIMVIYHACPVIDYSLTALNFDVVKTEVDDYANPVFDQLGFQELPLYFLDSSVFDVSEIGDSSSDDTVVAHCLGYTNRYFDYKTAVDMTLGDFRETSVTWLSPVNFDYLKNFIVNGHFLINANFFKVNPAILDPIFALKAGTVDGYFHGANTVATDQLRVFSVIECNMVRPLDYNGVPY